jgi:hypothetical protein
MEKTKKSMITASHIQELLTAKPLLLLIGLCFLGENLSAMTGNHRFKMCLFFASAAVLCYNTAPLTGHGLASPGCRSLGLLCLHSWF